MSSSKNFNIPKTQKVIRSSNYGPNFELRIDHYYPVPVPLSTQVLVKLSYTGVCHSDWSVLTGEWGYEPTTTIPGHEGVGRVVQLGSEVPSSEAYIGMKVGVALVSNPCGSCESCLQNDGEVLCRKTNSSTNYGYYGEFRDGTWQQYVVVEKNYIIPVPEECPDELVGPALCGGVTVYKGIKKSGLKAGEWLVIPGCGGGLGSFGIQFAVARGLRVIGIDNGLKKDVCEKLGVEHFIDFTKVKDIPKEIHKITSIGAHGVVVLAPISKIYNEASDYLREQGTMVCIGIPPSEVKLSISLATIIEKCLNIKGSLVGTRSDIIEALDFVARGKVTPVVTVYPMEAAKEVLNLMNSGKLHGRGVLKLLDNNEAKL